jgi:hypothetical protein
MPTVRSVVRLLAHKSGRTLAATAQPLIDIAADLPATAAGIRFIPPTTNFIVLWGDCIRVHEQGNRQKAAHSRLSQ